jgi:general secretion pathway protein C
VGFGMLGYERAVVIVRELAERRMPKGDSWATLVAIVLGALLSARSVQLGLSLRPARADRDSGFAVAAVQGSGAGGRSVTQQRDLVLAAHLFGGVAPAANAPLNPTPAQWVLSGIIQGSTPESGLAILGENAHSTRLRAVGEEAFNGFTLVQVLADRVTLEGRGQRFALRLPRTRLALLGTPGGTAASDAAPAIAVAKGIWHPRKGEIGVPLPAQAMLRPQPHHDAEGNYQGLQVMNIDSSISSQGLQRADVITAVDGHPITSPAAAQQALQQLSSGSAVMVTVERDGAPVQLPLTISEHGGS